MSLVAFDGTPLISVGQAGRPGSTIPGSAGATLLDAANEACIMIGQIFTEDGASHTIDTTGSSSLGFRTGTVTFANAGTTLKVGIAAVDSATGPPGRAVNVADVITFDVSSSSTGGGGGITTNAWQEKVPDTGSKAIANGDLVALCIQMTARGGVDAVNVTTSLTIATGAQLPSVTGFIGAAYATQNRVPNAVITFSDGKLGFFFGGYVSTTPNSTQTWSNASSPNEYGNFFQMPFPSKIYGISTNCDISGDTDLVLYSDPLGTPVAQRTVSIDLNTVGLATTSGTLYALFSSPYSTTAAQPLAAIMKPTSATSVNAVYTTFNSSAHQKSLSPGSSNGYAVNRASGAFAAQNANKDRFGIGLLVGAFEHGVGPTYTIGI